MTRRLTIAALLLLAAGPAAAQFAAPGGAVPVVANLPGINSFWRSDVSILNVGGKDTTVQMILYPEIKDGQPTFATKTSQAIPLPAGRQLDLRNIVQATFGLLDVKGALQIFSTDGTPLVIGSRTYTQGSEGSYGQDVTSVLVADRAWVAGIEEDSLYRTNVGIFWPWNQPVQFTIDVYDSDGNRVGGGTIEFAQAGLQQRSLHSFGVSGIVGGYVVFSASDSQTPWYAYATTVDGPYGGGAGSNDGVYRPARSFQLGSQ
jgi:hypothetical protein